MLLLIVILLLLFGFGGGGYWGYSRWGTGGGLGIVGILLVILVLFWLSAGEFPTRPLVVFIRPLRPIPDHPTAGGMIARGSRRAE